MGTPSLNARQAALRQRWERGGPEERREILDYLDQVVGLPWTAPFATSLAEEETAPSWKEALLCVACTAWRKQDELAWSELCYRRAVALGIGSPDLVFCGVRLFVDQGRVGEAFKVIEGAFAVGCFAPDSRELGRAFFYQGHLYAKVHRWGKAFMSFDLAARNLPADDWQYRSSSLMNAGTMLSKLRRFDEAGERFRATLDLLGERPLSLAAIQLRAHTNALLGLTLDELGDRDRAKRLYELALADMHDPGTMAAVRLLLYRIVGGEHRRLAYEALEKLPFPLAKKAIALLDEGRLDEAVEILLWA